MQLKWTPQPASRLTKRLALVFLLVATLLAIGGRTLIAPGVFAIRTSPTVYVANDTSRSVSVINTTTNTVSTTIELPDRPQQVALNPVMPRLYVVLQTDLAIIDTTTNTQVRSPIPLAGPYGIAVSPDGTRVYVGDYSQLDGPHLTIIDAATNDIIGNPLLNDTAKFAAGFAVNPSGTRVYIAAGSPQGGTQISIFDVATSRVIATAPLPSVIMQSPDHLAFDPSGAHLYGVSQNWLVTLDTATNSVLVPTIIGSAGEGVTASPDGRRVYTANWGAGSISIVDTTGPSPSVVATEHVGTQPYGLALDPSGGHLYMFDQVGNTAWLFTIGHDTLTLDKIVQVGARPIDIAVKP